MDVDDLVGLKSAAWHWLARPAVFEDVVVVQACAQAGGVDAAFAIVDNDDVGERGYEFGL